MYYYIMIIDFYCGDPLGWDWDENWKKPGLRDQRRKGTKSVFFFFFFCNFFLLSLPLSNLHHSGTTGGRGRHLPPERKKKAFSFPYQPQPQLPQTRLPFYLTLPCTWMGSSMPRKRNFFFFNLSGISLLFYMQAPKKIYFPPAPGPQSQRKNMIRSNFAPQKRRKKTALHANFSPPFRLFPHPSRHSTTPEYLFICLFIYLFIFVLVCVEVIPLESW